MEIEDKISRLKQNIRELEVKKSNCLSRKERAAHLIKVGALLEIAGIDKVDKEILLGYLLWFKDVPEEKLEKLKKKGKEEFDKRKKHN